MSYLVLARKYRPSTFADIVGQNHVVRTLQNAIKLDRVHHAFLFTGARGVGKTTTARVLARALNCEQGPTESPCGSCAACTEIAASSSPDVLEIDGASNRGVDSVRELRETVRYLPSRGRHKLYIIDEVHQLTSEAFNALLKTLEEPPLHVKFIFATTEPQKIPATILSRCQRFDFRRVSIAALGEHLRQILGKEGVTLSAKALATVVREAQGSVRDALSLLDQVLSYAGGDLDDAQVIEALGVVDRDAIFKLCDAVLAKDADTVLRLVAEVDARGHDLGDVAGLLVEHFRDLMVAKVVDSPSEALLDRSPGEIENLRQQSDRLSRPDLHRFFSLLVGVADDVSRSTHARISLEMGLLRLLELEPAESLGTLLTRLDDLVSGGGAPSGSASGPKAAEAPASGGLPESGGVAAESGGVAAESGGVAAESGGVAAESGGVAAESGGVAAESGGVAAESGGVAAESGATRPEAPGPSRAGSTSDWSGLVERVRALRPALASVMEHGRPLCFGPDRVEIAYPRNTFYWESAHERENRDMLDRVLAEQFGGPVPFALVAETADTAVATLAESDERREQERVQQITKGALEHPAVRGAISILGGEVKEVIPLDRSEEPG